MTHLLIVAGYAFIVGAMALVEVAAHRWPNSIAPLGEMLDQVMRSRTVRLGMIAAWWWLGWHFLVAETVQFTL